MMRVRILLLCAGLLAGLFSPAHAHRLKLFATVEGGAITGYAFFAGGGRARNAEIIFRSTHGTILHRLRAGEDGSFRWTPDSPRDVTVIVNTGEGHGTKTTVNATRFAGPGKPNPATGPASTVAQASSRSAPANPDIPPEIARLVEEKVDTAVARQIKPLMEAYARAEARVRFNDVAGGIGMIIGLAGIALWAMGRRRRAAPVPRETDGA